MISNINRGVLFLLLSAISAVNLFSDSIYLSLTDTKGRVVTIDKEPQRIISMAPGITETIYALGGENKLAGRTDFCDYPASATELPSVGSLFSPNLEKILSLNPDLIIASAHFKKEILEKIEDLSIQVVVIDEYNSIEGIYQNILNVGKIIGKTTTAEKVVASIKKDIEETINRIKNLEKPTVYYVVGYGQYGDFTAGGDTYISTLINKAGGINIAQESSGWSYSLEKIVEKNPDIIICSQYYNTKEGLLDTPGYRDLPAVKKGNLFTIDNNKLDRQGPRIGEALKELAQVIHGDDF